MTPAARLAAGGVPGGLGAGGGAGASASPGGGLAGAGGGVGIVGGGVPGAALTSYTRPTSSFAPENSGRPVSLKSGLLSAAELRGPTTTAGGSAVPVSPAQAGMLGSGKAENGKGEVQHARIVVAGDRPPRSEHS